MENVNKILKLSQKSQCLPKRIPLIGSFELQTGNSAYGLNLKNRLKFGLLSYTAHNIQDKSINCFDITILWDIKSNYVS